MRSEEDAGNVISDCGEGPPKYFMPTLVSFCDYEYEPFYFIFIFFVVGFNDDFFFFFFNSLFCLCYLVRILRTSV